MKQEVELDLPAVPEVTMECFIVHPTGEAMTRIRLEGRRFELQSMLQEFSMLVQLHQHESRYRPI